MEINFIESVIEFRDRIKGIIQGTTAHHNLEEGIGNLVYGSTYSLFSCLLAIQTIPEEYTHDSTQEKNWAKVSDILISIALSQIGFSSSVSRGRQRSPDVVASCNNHFSLVADAKCFRLSRTAKNQKDFKIASLGSWRENNNARYAFLCAPLFAFPVDESEVYMKATEANVTLLSYIHFVIILECILNSNTERTCMMFERVLNYIAFSSRDFRTGVDYWRSFNEFIVQTLGIDRERIREYLGRDSLIMRELVEIERMYYNRERSSIEQMSVDQLKEEVLRERVYKKIRTIDQTMGKYERFLRNLITS